MIYGLRCQNLNLICDIEVVRTIKSMICGLRCQNLNLICDTEAARTIESMINGLRCQNIVKHTLINSVEADFRAIYLFDFSLSLVVVSNRTKLSRIVRVK